MTNAYTYKHIYYTHNTCIYTIGKYNFINLAFTHTEFYAHIIGQTYLLLTGYWPSIKGGIKNGK